MPNQINYPEKLSSTRFQRPSRIEKADVNLLNSGEQQILFGTSDKDIVEIWVYNPDGTFAGHAIILPSDTALSLTTLIDQSGPQELLNVDLRDVSNRMSLAPGRYSFVLNFFRDEVGSEIGNRLYILEISNDRTELRLTPVQENEIIKTELYEFVTPSVPRRFAQGLIDQTFGKSLDVLDSEKISNDKIMLALNALHTNTSNQVDYANVKNAYDLMILKLIERAYVKALDYMALDSNNFAIQEVEFMNYIEKAINDVIYDMKQAGEIDLRFSID